MPTVANGQMSAAMATLDTPKTVALIGLAALALLVLIAHGYRPV
jgi:hypothetical protein